MANKLSTLLAKFDNRQTYSNLDKTALDISRKAAAGSLGDTDYAEWAMVSDDPLVIADYVKTFVTTLSSKLSSSPFRPDDQELVAIADVLNLNDTFAELYMDVLNDGYSYLGVGIADGVPHVRVIDARYIMFNGDAPSLKDATDVVVFEVCPNKLEENEFESFPSGYVDFDEDEEHVVTSHYHKDDDGQYVLDVYKTYDGEPKTYKLEGLDRIPIVRFVGERVELSDKRFHYRGLYYLTGSVIKAMALAATKVQVHVAAMDDANWVAPNDGISNHKEYWDYSGVKPYDEKDANGLPISKPIQVQHDNNFLVSAFGMWKSVIADLLGPVVASSSEAVTREEVLARNEVRDAITNVYMSRMADGIREVYRCIRMLMGRGTNAVAVYGGYLDNVKRQKAKNELEFVYNKAREAGLNTQGFVSKFLEFSDIDDKTKLEIEATLRQDPFASPQTLQLKQQLQQSQKMIQDQERQIALLKLQATQRLERQSDYVEMQERVKRAELAFKQWQQETKDTQSARMELLKKALEIQDIPAALQILGSVEQRDPLVTSTPAVAADMNNASGLYDGAAQQHIMEVTNVANNSRSGGQSAGEQNVGQPQL